MRLSMSRRQNETVASPGCRRGLSPISRFAREPDDVCLRNALRSLATGGILMAGIQEEAGSPFAALSGITNSVISDLGDFALFSGRMFAWMIRRRLRRGSLIPVLHSVGVRSVPV